MTRKSRGRQKIEMTRMSKASNLLVTFSKRRSGLFKKAYELHTLCGAEIAILVFSPGKKVFSYGHPCLYSIIDRFVTGKSSPNSSSSSNNPSSRLLEAHRNASIRELNMQLTEMLNQLEADRKRGEELIKLRKANREKCWWEAPVNELGVEELEQLKVAMEELKKNVAKQAEKLIVDASNNMTALFGTSSEHVVGPSNIIDVKVQNPPGLGLSMTPHGSFSTFLGYGRGFF
ncbi:hypothetical protein ACH5RR_002129 [Cinchona calisaya]|uniref:MADS-box domain-containing protein n=1 Tax=Cinchona calisaya TaxID=153742 RepID=A0ABD3B5E7_9GENT